MIEINNQRQSIGSDEFSNSLNIGESFGQIISAFIEFLEQNNRFGRNFVFGSDIRTGFGNTELIIVIGSGDFFESFSGVGFEVVKKSDNGDFVIFNKGFCGLYGIESSCWRSGFLFNPSDNGIGGTTSVIFCKRLCFNRSIERILKQKYDHFT